MFLSAYHFDGDPAALAGVPAHPDCVAALDDAVTLCASLGHELLEADLPGLTPEIGAESCLRGA